jgi:hypothetical protein
MPQEKPDVDIYTMVTAIREQLETMDQERRALGHSALLQLAEMELELNFVVHQKRGIDGKLDLKIVSVGGDSAIENEKVQKIRLKFNLADSSIPDKTLPVGARLHSSSEKASKRVPTEPL